MTANAPATQQQFNLPIEYAPGHSPIIRNVIPGLPEIGKIKIGAKGSERTAASGEKYQIPVKFDHFIVTTLERGSDNNFLRNEDIHKSLGDKPKSIPIFLPYENLELNFQSRYACYTGKTLWCSGDGQAAFRLAPGKTEREQVSCTCERCSPTYQEKDKCKMHGTLGCIVRGATSIGGIWKFRTTGYNSTTGLTASLAYLQLQTGGHLARIPLLLKIRAKAATNPVDGKPVTIQVVGVEFDGDTKELEKTVLQIIQKDAEFRRKLIAVERETQKLLSVDAVLVDEAGDIQEEHFPEEQQPSQPELATPGAGRVGTAAAAAVAPAEQPAATGKRGRTRKSAQAVQVPAEQAPAQPAAATAPDAAVAPLAAPANPLDVNLFD
jgi:hypothetical protein